jgi:nucleoside-diphosphate-sugar epimerase
VPARTVLVTGATGFVGRATLPVLRSAGWYVRAALRQPGPCPGADSTAVIGDIGPDTDWSSALAGVDAVLHLAAVAHQVGREGPELDLAFARVNRDGTAALARAVAASPSARRLVFVSSIGAIASFADRPLDEAAVPRPDTPYGRSKRAAEEAIESILARAAADWVIIRPPLVYGPGNPGNMARLVGLVRRGLPLPLASLRNARSFVAVANLARLLALALESPAASRRTYHVADAETWSTPELLRVLADAAFIPCRLFHCPPGLLSLAARGADLAGRALGKGPTWGTYAWLRLSGSLAVDASRANAELGWLPHRSLRDEAPAMLARDAAPPR